MNDINPLKNKKKIFLRDEAQNFIVEEIGLSVNTKT